MTAAEADKRTQYRREADRLMYDELQELRRAIQTRVPEDVYDELADAMPHIVWTAGPDGTLNYFNRRWYEYTGLTPEQTRSWAWAPVIHPDDLRGYTEAWDHAMVRGEGYEMECRFRRADGIFRWHLTRVTPVRSDENKIQQWIGTSTDFQDQKRVQDKLETAARALTTSEERLAELNRSLEQQVAERTEELRRKEEELQQTRKLEALGQLAGGVAHDFNNLLTGMMGITEQLHQEFPPNDDRRAELEEVLQAGQRAVALTRQLLTFGRRQVVAPTLLDINMVIRELEKMIRRLIREDIRLEIRLAASKPQVRMDRGQLEQILINLVVNSRDAMPQGGMVVIETEGMTATKTFPAHIDLLPGPYVRLSVVDTGIGMDEETLKHAFEPFFSTKAREQGNGLGLSTVYGIVKQNRGAISLQSKMSQGTRVEIYLPRVSAPEPVEEFVRQSATPANAVKGGDETILVVEDEDLVRRVVCTALRKKGYKILEARNGFEALRLSRQFDSRIDLVITDVVMPEMNGRQLVEHLQMDRPGTVYLYMSGYAKDLVDSQGMLPPGTPFIEKPDLVGTLPQRVREVLDARR